MKRNWIAPILIGLIAGLAASTINAVTVNSVSELESKDSANNAQVTIIQPTAPTASEQNKTPEESIKDDVKVEEIIHSTIIKDVPKENATVGPTETTQKNETEIVDDTTNKENNEVEVKSEDTNNDALVDTNKTEEQTKTCNHFWRSEYIPETKESDGYVVHTCLHCGEWYIFETIPAIE